MVRDSRIKEISFPDNGVWSGANVFNAAGSTVFSTIYSKSINGEILSIESSFDRAGSFAIGISGLNTEIWRSNTISGTNWLHTQPREFSSSTTGSIAGADHVPFIVNGPLYLSAGSISSGTKPLQIQVRYR